MMLVMGAAQYAYFQSRGWQGKAIITEPLSDMATAPIIIESRIHTNGDPTGLITFAEPIPMMRQLAVSREVSAPRNRHERRAAAKRR